LITDWKDLERFVVRPWEGTRCEKSSTGRGGKKERRATTREINLHLCPGMMFLLRDGSACFSSPVNFLQALLLLSASLTKPSPGEAERHRTRPFMNHHITHTSTQINVNKSMAAQTSLISGCNAFWEQVRTSTKRHEHANEWIRAL
jgi:hypothetical protein